LSSTRESCSSSRAVWSIARRRTRKHMSC
jgi:hypothetical protein